MSAVLSQIFSEFETEAQAASYDRWFRAKVERALTLADDPSTPRYTSDEVARRINSIIETEQAARNFRQRLIATPQILL